MAYRDDGEVVPLPPWRKRTKAKRPDCLKLIRLKPPTPGDEYEIDGFKFNPYSLSLRCAPWSLPPDMLAKLPLHGRRYELSMYLPHDYVTTLYTVPSDAGSGSTANAQRLYYMSLIIIRFAHWLAVPKEIDAQHPLITSGRAASWINNQRNDHVNGETIESLLSPVPTRVETEFMWSWTTDRAGLISGLAHGEYKAYATDCIRDSWLGDGQTVAQYKSYVHLPMQLRMANFVVRTIEVYNWVRYVVGGEKIMALAGAKFRKFIEDSGWVIPLTAAEEKALVGQFTWLDKSREAFARIPENMYAKKG